MVSEEQEAVAEQEVLDLDSIMADYRRRQRIEAAVGPVISLLFHLVLIVSAAMFFTGHSSVDKPGLEVQMEELEVKELDEKKLEELEQVEEIVEEVVPTVEKPEITREETDISTEDFSDDMLAQTNNNMDFSEVLDITHLP